MKLKFDLAKKLGLNIKKEKYHIIPIFIPHRGCKNECVFCNQKKISGEMRNVTLEDVRKTIEEYLKVFPKDTKENKKHTVQIAFFGGSFTGLEKEEMEGLLSVAGKYIKKGLVQNIRISTRPDYITKEILKTLKENHVKVIELGVQSMDPNVLLKSKRGHTKEDVKQATKLIHKFGFDLGLQVMIGLPESTLKEEIQTIKECIKLKPKMIRLYPVYVLEGSELYNMYKQKIYTPLELKEAIERTRKVYEECIKRNINVIRIGLQTTEEINQNNNSIAGPVCDNYREKILSQIAVDNVDKVIQKKIERKNVSNKYTNIEITVPKEQVNYIVGNNKVNIKYFEDTFNIKVRVHE